MTISWPKEKDNLFDQFGFSREPNVTYNRKPFKVTKTYLSLEAASVVSTLPQGTITTCQSSSDYDVQTDQGYIATPNFPNNYPSSTTCRWSIRASSHQVVWVKFESFSTEFKEDYLSLFDGYTTLSTTFRRAFSGAIASNYTVYRSSGSHLGIRFRADGSVEFKGVLIRFWKEDKPVVPVSIPGLGNSCPYMPTILNETEADFYSPNYGLGKLYPSKVVCRWIIQVPDGKIIRFSPVHADIPISGALKVYIRGSYQVKAQYGGDPIHKRMHGYHLWDLAASQVLVEFEAGSDRGTGFHVHYEAIDPPPGCGVQDRIVILRGNEGALFSPMIQTGWQYISDANYRWLIQVQSPQRVRLTFVYMDTSDGSCTTDVVRVYDGPSTLYPRLGIACNRNTPTFTSNGTAMLVQFRSSFTDRDVGFYATYKAVFPVMNRCVQGQVIDINQEKGRVATPNYGTSRTYPTNSNCMWRITVNDSMVIQLDVMELDLQLCYGDTMRVYDGPNDSYPMLATICGQKVDHNITTTGNTVFLHFVSDAALASTYDGVLLQYKAVDKGMIEKNDCPPTVKRVEGNSGNISSPFFGTGRLYSNMAFCQWRITVDDDRVIQLQFVTFDLENCWADRVQLYDGPDETFPLMEVLCGRGTNRTFTTSGNELYITFRTDEFGRGQGFTATYDSIVPTKKFSNGCPDSPVTLRNHSGTITSPGFGEGRTYSHGLNCTWIIILPENQQVVLRFGVFDLEHHKKCEYDKLVISEETHSKTLCGSGVMRNYTSRSHTLTLTFTSDESLAGRGFQVFYTGWTSDVCPDTPVMLTGSHGNVSSPNYGTGRPYPKNLRCWWQIQVDNGKVIELQVYHFRTLSSSDTLKVYDSDGPNATDPHMSTVEGQGTYPIDLIRSRANKMYLYFRTGNSDADAISGFYAEYRALSNPGSCPRAPMVVTAQKGYIHFPDVTPSGGPSMYPLPDTCSWRIDVQPFQRIFLTVTYMTIKCNSKLLVYDGRTDSAALIREACDVETTKASSSANHMLVVIKDVGVYVFEFRAHYITMDAGRLASDMTCGIRASIPSPFLVTGGQDAVAGGWPWFASLFRANHTHVQCGATILTETFLLTAATCLHRCHPEKFYERSEIYVRIGSVVPENGTRYNVKAYHIHPDYIPCSTYDNNLALLELDTGLSPSRDVGRACLPINPVRENDRCYLTGAGRKGLSGVSENMTRLQEAIQMTKNKSHCRENRRLPESIRPDMFCAESSFRGKGCVGDIGSPLTCEDSGQQHLRGVLSMADCGNEADTYTDVYYHKDWITSVIQKERIF